MSTVGEVVAISVEARATIVLIPNSQNILLLEKQQEDEVATIEERG